MSFDYLIVGAGLTGATLARELTDAGKRCLVIDKRNHIGGNAILLFISLMWRRRSRSSKA